MNSVMTMPSVTSQQDDLAFLAFPAKRAAEQVSGTTTDMLQSIGTMLGRILGKALCAKTSVQFCAIRDETFSSYMQIMMGLTQLIRATVSDTVIDRLTYESLSEMEADFRQDGPPAFGEELSHQALFTIWTLRKINEMSNSICTADDVKPHLVGVDLKLAQDFVTHVLYGRFHLDCLRLSLKSNIPVYPEVMERMSDGLRPVVNAYSYIKQATDLRCSPPDEQMIDIEFDEEEQDLLALSMGDLQTEASGACCLPNT